MTDENVKEIENQINKGVDIANQFFSGSGVNAKASYCSSLIVMTKQQKDEMDQALDMIWGK